MHIYLCDFCISISLHLRFLLLFLIVNFFLTLKTLLIASMSASLILIEVTLFVIDHRVPRSHRSLPDRHSLSPRDSKGNTVNISSSERHA